MGLIAVQAAALGLLFGTWPVAAVAVVAAAATLSERLHWKRTTDRQRIAALVLALPFAVAWRLTRAHQPEAGFVETGFSIAGCEYFIALQVLQLLVRKRDELPAAMPLFAAFGLVFAGSLMAEPAQNRVYQAPSLGGTGFSESVRLGSVKRLKCGPLENRAAVRVFSREDPGYLRGRAYDTDADSRWDSGSAAAPLQPATPPASLPRSGIQGNTCALEPRAAGRWEAFDTWPDPSIEESVFLPLGAAVWRAPVQSAEVDEHGVV
ncbi:MAG: hypothetical protein GW802_26250, partial [Armatimonadetes bacterium]|nr:hypothetical protein [Armatimonadota bacterium]